MGGQEVSDVLKHIWDVVWRDFPFNKSIWNSWSFVINWILWCGKLMWLIHWRLMTLCRLLLSQKRRKTSWICKMKAREIFELTRICSNCTRLRKLGKLAICPNIFLWNLKKNLKNECLSLKSPKYFITKNQTKRIFQPKSENYNLSTESEHKKW